MVTTWKADEAANCSMCAILFLIGISLLEVKTDSDGNMATEFFLSFLVPSIFLPAFPLCCPPFLNGTDKLKIQRETALLCKNILFFM